MLGWVIGVVGLGLAVGVLVLLWLTRASHEMYDSGEGWVKVRCPEEDELKVYTEASTIPCPGCGMLLKRTTKRCKWTGVTEG
jgi:predicted RNA-binding Zn-ribbon protein involved in translation (DUF1610 family)